jgi:hypothetical protein
MLTKLLLSLLKTVNCREIKDFPAPPPIPSGCLITILSTLVSLLSFRVRSRASLELELIALRHQLIVLRRQHSRRPQLFLTDRLFWV